MKIQTLSIIVGTTACNAQCSFCVSRITPSCGLNKIKKPNFRNLQVACKFSKDCGVSTILLTGKGEPLIKKHRDLISEYLMQIESYSFPFIELQTNGTEIINLDPQLLEDWYNLGLTAFIISCVHYETEKNREIYNTYYPSLETLIKYLHKIGFSVRLSCVMLKEYIDNVKSLLQFIEKCKKWKVEQFTARPVINSLSPKENNKEKKAIYEWIKEHEVPQEQYEDILNHFEWSENSTSLMSLMHGATVYDYKGQNVCLSTCLTHSTNPSQLPLPQGWGFPCLKIL